MLAEVGSTLRIAPCQANAWGVGLFYKRGMCVHVWWVGGCKMGAGAVATYLASDGAFVLADVRHCACDRSNVLRPPLCR